MPFDIRTARVQSVARRPWFPLGKVLVLACALLSTSYAQTPQYTQGLPTVGSPTSGLPPASTAAPSQMSIDATQFSSGTDMCGAIAAACGKLTNTVGAAYPAGATIDARGFTGNQVCAASNITTMIFQCVPQGSSTGAIGGKLLLGNVNLYADGPASGNYTDNIGTHPSGIGTPALIIPSFFWGIEGVSRGATGGSTPGTGTFLSVCLGPNNPIGGSNPCHNAFPQRSFPITKTTVSGNTMTITVSGTLIQPGFTGTNVYPAELVMVKGAMGSAAADNGTYKIQLIESTVLPYSVNVTVPSGTPPCSSTCGSLFLGTPILGFASTSAAISALATHSDSSDGRKPQVRKNLRIFGHLIAAILRGA